jgi:hypothetical protein
MNRIKRTLAHNLGFDEVGQLVVGWEENGTTVSTIISDMRGKTCAICGRPWEVTAESFRNQYWDQSLNLWMHKTCFLGQIGVSQAVRFMDVICSVRDRQWYGLGFEMAQIPNEYGAAWNTPWWRVNFRDFIPWMKIGARKRVFHMSLHDLTKEQVELFNSRVVTEDVTKGSDLSSVYIHAGNYDKVSQYFCIFLEVLALDKPNLTVEKAAAVSS